MVRYRKTYEVTGYTYNASAYCVEHKPNVSEEELGVIFLGTEWDYAPCCDVCQGAIECTIITPGFDTYISGGNTHETR